MMSKTALPESLATTLAGLETHHQAAGLPWVTLSYAQSMDGSIAARRGTPLLLSSTATLEITHHLRACHDAILGGIGTVLADNPRLNVRLVPGEDPQPVVLDNQLRFPLDAYLVTRGVKPPWIMASMDAPADRARLLSRTGARIFRPSPGRVELSGVLQDLAREGVRSVMVEGGARVITAFLQERIVNGIVITISPILVGGLHAIEEPLVDDRTPLKAPQNFPSIQDLGVHRLGDDLLVWGRPHWGPVTEA